MDQLTTPTQPAQQQRLASEASIWARLLLHGVRPGVGVRPRVRHPAGHLLHHLLQLADVPVRHRLLDEGQHLRARQGGWTGQVGTVRTGRTWDASAPGFVAGQGLQMKETKKAWCQHAKQSPTAQQLSTCLGGVVTLTFVRADCCRCTVTGTGAAAAAAAAAGEGGRAAGAAAGAAAAASGTTGLTAREVPALADELACRLGPAAAAAAGAGSAAAAATSSDCCRCTGCCCCCCCCCWAGCGCCCCFSFFCCFLDSLAAAGCGASAASRAA